MSGRNLQPSHKNIILPVNVSFKPQIGPRLTFQENVAYHVHIKCLLVDTSTSGGEGEGGGVVTANKAAK